MQYSKKYNFLIIGQGLAGTVLAHTLLAENFSLLIADEFQENTSSKIAAGLFNPITGRNLQQSWLAKTLFPVANQFYADLEEQLKDKFYFPKNIYRILNSIAEQNDWSAQDQFFGEFDEEKRAFIKADFGGVRVHGGGYVDIAQMLLASAKKWQTEQIFLDNAIEFEDIKPFENGFLYQNMFFEKIIWARGNGELNKNLWSFLPFKPVRGEVLFLNIKEKLADEIYNSGVWVLPHHKGYAKLGATYDRDNLDLTTTEEGKNFLLEKAKKFLTADFEVCEHKFGIRPTTIDRRIFMGEHPNEKGHFIFNGLGAKGVSLAPYFAKQYADFFSKGTDFHQEMCIKRFQKK